jgi:AcrR family transcriptional regulator
MPKKGVGQERKKQIMASLNRCLLKKQFHEITIKDIAAEAGINHGMIYYFYKSKEDVLLHFVEYVADNYRTDFVDYITSEKANSMTGKSLLHHVMAFSNDRITLNRNLSMIFIEIWGIANHNINVRKKLRSLYEEWVFYIEDTLEKCGVSDERAKNISKAMVSFFEGNALFSILFDWKEEELKTILDEFQNRIMDMIDQ